MTRYRHIKTIDENIHACWSQCFSMCLVRYEFGVVYLSSVAKKCEK